MTKKEFWKIIDECDWAHNKDCQEAIKRMLVKKFKTAAAARGFVDVYADYKSSLDRKLNKLITNIGDDGYSDLLAHIIGLGEAEYTAVMNNPRLAIERAEKYDFAESFSYVIPHEYDFRSVDLDVLKGRAKEYHARYFDGLHDANLVDVRSAVSTVMNSLETLFNGGNARKFLVLETEILSAIEKIENTYKMLDKEMEARGYVPVDSMGGLRNNRQVKNLINHVKEYLVISGG